METVELRPLAEVFFATEAEPADAAGRMEPGGSHALSLFETVCALTRAVHDTHDLMSGDPGQDDVRELADDRMQVGMADPAAGNTDENLSCPDLRPRGFG